MKRILKPTQRRSRTGSSLSLSLKGTFSETQFQKLFNSFNLYSTLVIRCLISPATRCMRFLIFFFVFFWLNFSLNFGTTFTCFSRARYDGLPFSSERSNRSDAVYPLTFFSLAACCFRPFFMITHTHCTFALPELSQKRKQLSGNFILIVRRDSGWLEPNFFLCVRFLASFHLLPQRSPSSVCASRLSLTRSPRAHRLTWENRPTATKNRLNLLIWPVQYAVKLPLNASQYSGVHRTLCVGPTRSSYHPIEPLFNRRTHTKKKFVSVLRAFHWTPECAELPHCNGQNAIHILAIATAHPTASSPYPAI